MPEKYEIDIDGEIFSVDIEEIDGEGLRATVSGTEFIVKLPEGVGSSPTPRRRSGGGGSKVKSGTVSTSIPGKIVTLEVTLGQEIMEGQVILILEAMKMQNEVTAPVSGKISSINCSEGENVEANMALVVITPNTEEGENFSINIDFILFWHKFTSKYFLSSLIESDYLFRTSFVDDLERKQDLTFGQYLPYHRDF